MRSLLAVAFFVVASFAVPAFSGVGKGQRAPDFALPTLSGEKLSLASLKGKVVIIDFWAQWCEPCKKELPQLEKLQKDYAARDVVVLAVSIDKQRANAERLVRELGISSLKVLLDPAGSVAATYDLPKMPSSYVVDKKGIVRFVHEGFEGAGDVEKFKQELDELTKQ